MNSECAPIGGTEIGTRLQPCAPEVRDARASCDMRFFLGIACAASLLVSSGCDRFGSAGGTSNTDGAAAVTSESASPMAEGAHRSADTTSSPNVANVAAAERVLREYLDASRESTLDPTTTSALSACGDGGQSFFPTTLLAGYTLLPFETRGDTVIGRAKVVTVAEQDIDRRSGGHFQARQRVRSDILEWDVIPVDGDEWVVCNGLRFGYTGADSLTTWTPNGASYVSARRLADSVVAASANATLGMAPSSKGVRP